MGLETAFAIKCIPVPGYYGEIRLASPTNNALRASLTTAN